MSNDTSLIAFKSISNFTNELASVFSEEHRPLKLYSHLIKKTTISHTEAIDKHINAFKMFCINNRSAIISQQTKEIKHFKISYSSRVFIDMKEIFDKADKETTDIIWKHLLTISACLDPTGKARQILQENNKGQTSGETDFLNSIISKVETSVNPNSNPFEALNSITQSGIFSELMQGMGQGLQNGSLDLGKLMGSVQNMVSQLNNQTGGSEGQDETMGMMNNVMSTMMNNLNVNQNIDNNNQQQIPDLANMLAPMMGAMFGANSTGKVLPDIDGMTNNNKKNNIEDID